MYSVYSVCNRMHSVYWGGQQREDETIACIACMSSVGCKRIGKRRRHMELQASVLKENDHLKAIESGMTPQR